MALKESVWDEDEEALALLEIDGSGWRLLAALQTGVGGVMNRMAEVGKAIAAHEDGDSWTPHGEVIDTEMCYRDEPEHENDAA